MLNFLKYRDSPSWLFLLPLLRTTNHQLTTIIFWSNIPSFIPYFLTLGKYESHTEENKLTRRFHGCLWTSWTRVERSTRRREGHAGGVCTTSGSIHCDSKNCQLNPLEPNHDGHEQEQRGETNKPVGIVTALNYAVRSRVVVFMTVKMATRSFSGRRVAKIIRDK